MAAAAACEGVEGVAHGPVADGVDVDVEALAVQGGDHLGQLLGAEHADAQVAGGTAVAVQVGLEHGRGAVLEHPVGEDLDRARPQPAHRAGLAPLDQAGQLGLAGLDLPAEGGHGPAGEPAPLGHRPVGGQHLRLDGRVLPGGDAQAVQVGLAALDGGLPLGRGRLGGEVGDQRLGRLVEGAGGLAGGVALDPAPRRVGGGPGDAGQLEGAAVDPGAVAVGRLEHDRPVGHDRVQGGQVRAGGAEGVHHPAAPQHPAERGVLGGVAGHGGRILLRLDPVEVALGQLEAAGGGVDVGVGEPGQDQPAVEGQHPGRRPAQAGQLALRAGGGDPAAAHGHGLGPGAGRVAGPHRRPDDHQVGSGSSSLLGGDRAGPVARAAAGPGPRRRSARAGQSTITTSTVAAMAE